MKNFIKKPFLLKNLLWLLAIFSIASIILPFFIEKPLLEKLTFIITALAFFAGATAIILQKKAMKQQKEDGKKAEESLKEQIKLQKEAMEEQKIIGAWQLLTTKAPGNSGKKEVIEFLASKGAPLSGIDLSAETHGGPVYLQGLFKDFKGDRSKIILNNAKFNGADLNHANFSETYLSNADFSKATLNYADFSKTLFTGASFIETNLARTTFNKVFFYDNNFTGAIIYRTHFSESDISCANFTDCKNFKSSALFDSNYFLNTIDPLDLPPAPHDYKFELDERVDENGKPIYPKGDPIYRFIKLVELKI